MAEITVAFAEHESSPIESGDRSGKFNFTRIFVTAWADRFTFLEELFTGGFLGLPQSYSPRWPGLFADTWKIDKDIINPDSVTITDPSTQALTHSSKAIITVTYSPLASNASDPQDEQLPDGTYAEYEQQEEGEFITVPSRGLRWNSDNKRISADVSAVIPQSTTRHVVTWHRVTNPPWQTMASLINKVNSVAWRIPATQQVFEPETLLYASRTAKISLSYNSTPSWTITLNFIEKAQKQLSATGDGPIGGTTVYGWNHQWRESTGAYDRVESAVGGDPVFQSADLRTIFTATA